MKEHGTRTVASGIELNPDHGTILSKALRETERLPNNYLQSWQEVQMAEQDSTAKIFLENGGFVAWFAYILVRQSAGKQSFSRGRSGFISLIDEIEFMPVEYRKTLAVAVTRNAEPEVRQRKQKLYEKVIEESRSDMTGKISRRKNS